MGLLEAEAILNRVFADMQRDEIKRIRSDPHRHRLTTIMEGACTSTSHWGGRSKRGDRIWFCVADHVNVAGYVLTWREVHLKKPRKVKGRSNISGYRDRWKAFKGHSAAVRLAKRRAENSRKRLEP